MSTSNQFAGGFFLGAIIGGVLGGIVGSTLIAQRSANSESGARSLDESNRDDRRSLDKTRKRMLSSSTQPDFESTRRGLEDKIAQLNDAIDEARQQLGGTRAADDDSFYGSHFSDEVQL